MLASLARWLRAAGHDAALAPAGASDAAVLAMARAENRLLLTRDARLAADADGHAAAIRLATDGLDSQAVELRRRLEVDWLRAPFSRCLVDNAALHPAGPAKYAVIPPLARALPGPVSACPRCGRVYWPGSHVRRMTARLRRWSGDPA